MEKEINQNLEANFTTIPSKKTLQQGGHIDYNDLNDIKTVQINDKSILVYTNKHNNQMFFTIRDILTMNITEIKMDNEDVGIDVSYTANPYNPSILYFSVTTNSNTNVIYVYKYDSNDTNEKTKLELIKKLSPKTDDYCCRSQIVYNTGSITTKDTRKENNNYELLILIYYKYRSWDIEVFQISSNITSSITTTIISNGYKIVEISHFYNMLTQENQIIKSNEGSLEILNLDLSISKVLEDPKFNGLYYTCHTQVQDTKAHLITSVCEDGCLRTFSYIDGSLVSSIKVGRSLSGFEFLGGYAICVYSEANQFIVVDLRTGLVGEAFNVRQSNDLEDMRYNGVIQKFKIKNEEGVFVMDTYFCSRVYKYTFKSE